MFWKRKILFAALLVGSFTAQNLKADDGSEAQIEQTQKKLSWLSADFSIDNSVGIGTFSPGYGRSPSWTTSFTLSPSVQLPLPSSWPKVLADAEFSANVWWLNSMQTSAFDANHRIQFPDLSFGISAPKFYEFSNLGISFSASIPFIVPISKSSRAISRVFGTGLGAGVKWKGGQFTVGYSPSARVWFHSNDSKTVPCFDADGDRGVVPGLVNPQNPDFEIDQYMLSLSVFREDDNVAGGRCAVVGRQNLATVKNGASVAWAYDAHKISTGLTYYWNFLRPLEYKPELAGLYSNSQSFTQAVMGKIAYSYTLPLAFEMAVSTGIVSYQGIFSKTGTPLFPFYDFETPRKNQTQLFVEMTASL